MLNFDREKVMRLRTDARQPHTRKTTQTEKDRQPSNITHQHTDPTPIARDRHQREYAFVVLSLTILPHCRFLYPSGRTLFSFSTLDQKQKTSWFNVVQRSLFSLPAAWWRQVLLAPLWCSSSSNQINHLAAAAALLLLHCKAVHRDMRQRWKVKRRQW